MVEVGVELVVQGAPLFRPWECLEAPVRKDRSQRLGVREEVVVLVVELVVELVVQVGVAMVLLP